MKREIVYHQIMISLLQNTLTLLGLRWRTRFRNSSPSSRSPCCKYA